MFPSSMQVRAAIPVRLAAAIDAAFKPESAKLVVVFSTSRNLQNVLAREYLKQRSNALAGEVRVLQRGRASMAEWANSAVIQQGCSTILFEELRADEASPSIGEVVALVQSGHRVVTFVHGFDEPSVVERLSLLLGRPVPVPLQLIAFQAATDGT